MRVRIVAVGKLREAYVREGVETYLKRLRPFCHVETVEVKDEKLLAEKARDAYAIALHPVGKQLSSEELAGLLKEKESVAFLIGGAEGLSRETLSKAHVQLSLSRMTFPHELSRLLLAEQLYRAFTILRGHPYHK